MSNTPQNEQSLPLKHPLKQWVAKHPKLCTFLLIVVLWQAFWWHFNTPIKNPWPDKPYTIKGRFPFDKGFDIVFGLSVSGDAKWHQWICGGIQVTYAGCSGGTEYFHPQKTDSKNYQITMYKDYYLRGLPLWDESVFFYKQYKAGIAFDFKASVIGGHIVPESAPIICDDSEKELSESKGKIFCMRQYDNETRQSGYKKYIHLILPASSQAGPNEQVMDFWLTSELDEMLKVQPTPTANTH
jgi:hypothetical protein